ncbi:MAG: PAS domain S-box protein [Bacteroidota bacterium]|nr:PAS domain S-box protein [Bacteroidota bacterium]
MRALHGKKDKHDIPKNDYNRWQQIAMNGVEMESLSLGKAIHNSIVNSSIYLCILTTETGLIKILNQAACTELGYTAQEVINKLSIEDLLVGTELKTRAKSLDNEFETDNAPGFDALKHQATLGREEFFPITFIGKNNVILQTQATVTAQYDENKKVIGYVIVGIKKPDMLQQNHLKEEFDKRFFEYIRNVPIGIFVADENGNYLIVNKAACKLSGYCATELLKKNRMDLIHPDDHQLAQESYDALIKVGHSIMDCRFITKTGKIRTWRVNAIQVHGDRYVGLVYDVTEQKKTQQELAKTYKYLETIFENIPNMLFLKDAKDLSFVQFNKAGEEITGYLREEMLGKNDFDLYPYEQAEFFRVKDREVLEGESSLVIEEELIQTRHKGERILHTKKVPIMDANGKPEYLLGISEDITERKAAEKEFLENKIELDNFFRLSPNLLCIAKIDFTITKINKVWEKLFGYRLNELMGQNFTCLVHPDDLLRTQQILSSLSPGHPISNFQNRYGDKKGNYIWVEWHIVSTGTQIYANGSNITSKIFYEEELRKAKEAAETASRAKSDFLANMSHEIRNPMNAIIGFAELLHNNVKDEKLLSQVDSIRNSGKVLLGILNDILDLSKIEAGKMKLELEPVNLNSLIKDVENMFRHRIHEKGLSFRVEKDTDISPKLILDEVRLRQILFNLIGNAVKFTEKGYICLAIKTALKSANTLDLTISVQDTGIGIPKEQQELIFETFQQQHGQSNKRFGGTGLGLSISKRLAEMMGGRITVTSEQDQGSIFNVILSNVKIQLEEHPDQKASEFDPTTILFEKAKVLIVEDSELNMNLILMTLENSNLELLTARNGSEAVEMTRKHHPHLILMDLRMPVMNGYIAAKIIKSEHTSNPIPIIAISASTKPDFKSPQYISLFDGYLMKPISLPEFIKLITHFLPYKTIEAKMESIEKTEDLIEISEEQKEHLDEVIDILENEFLPINETVIKKQLIEQIDYFGKGLILFGEANSLNFIVDYGKKICHYVDNFEIELMMKTLRSFPDIIEKVKSLNRSSQRKPEQ